MITDEEAKARTTSTRVVRSLLILGCVCCCVLLPFLLVQHLYVFSLFTAGLAAITAGKALETARRPHRNDQSS